MRKKVGWLDKVKEVGRRYIEMKIAMWEVVGMATNIRKLLILIFWGVIVLETGCASPVNHKSPEELLSLTVAGLSGIDHYSFSGKTDITLGDRVKLNSASFHGTVREHGQVKVKSNEQSNSAAIGSPLKLLKQVQETAHKTELLKDQSGQWTSVLSITSNEKSSTRIWANNLRSEFAEIAKRVPTASKGHAMKARSLQSQAALEQEWKTELLHSQAEFDRMVSTLHVQTTYKLTLDRRHLTPLRLKELSILHYKTADGEQQKETKTTDMTFLLTGKSGS
ncbi:hypothetical protein [Paenibacillus baekrokdamisoli]|uniref:hypothetical protein n=1 Tax=Paenibacillus baekrokdamisoli TaxID=1712516 RepID=UPI000F7790B0|nr:hypothetical protein [Paenibacillus baekrokdamisoli]